MDIEQLRTFLTVVESGSFSVAARSLHLSQPNVSICIRSLETELGYMLLKRSAGQRSKIEPTQEGIIFAEFCSNTLLSYARLQNALIKKEVIQPFVLVASPSANLSIMPFLLRAFHQAYPNVPYKYATYPTAQNLAKIENGEADIAVISNDESGSVFEWRDMIHDPMELICPQNADIKDQITIAKLKKLPLILRDKHLNSMMKIDSALQKAGSSLDEMSVVLEVHGMPDVLQSVSNGMGCGFVPRSMLLNSSVHQGIRPVSVKNLDVQRYLRLCRLKNRPLSQSASYFWDYALSTIWHGKLSFAPVTWKSLTDLKISE